MEVTKIPTRLHTSPIALSLDNDERKLLHMFFEVCQNSDVMGMMNETYGSTEKTVQLGVMLQQLERELRD